MFDLNLNLSRKESSVLMSKTPSGTRKRQSNTRLSKVSIRNTPTIQVQDAPRARGSVRKEIITSMFDSMLNDIVESWTVTAKESIIKKEADDPLLTYGKKAKAIASRPVIGKLQLPPIEYKVSIAPSFWIGNDTKATIHFKNGNLYEGDISMKCMHGHGRFQWADGTVYEGKFEKNTMIGQGEIHWANDTWYTGEFVGNLRHGRGLFVDSRRQRSYCGDWLQGAKHGKGFIDYAAPNLHNNYYGEWVQNKLNGIGCREYSASSGSNGAWKDNKFEGYGLMIWDNHDVYLGEWVNHKMSGLGKYIWGAYNNIDLVLDTMQYYEGTWKDGKCCGYGSFNFGFENSSNCKITYLNNCKNKTENIITSEIKYNIYEPPHSDFDFVDTMEVQCDIIIKEAVDNIVREENVKKKFFEKYLPHKAYYNWLTHKDEASIQCVIENEKRLLRCALRHFDADLRIIYERYATVCKDGIHYMPCLIRLFLWQFYLDCHLREKGLTLVQIDDMVATPRIQSTSQANSNHYPFEIVHYWQFLGVLVLIANYLYGKKTWPGPRPDNIMAGAFRRFMTNDVLPNYNTLNGCLVRYLKFVPLNALYELYCSVGELHTVRTFLCAVRGLDNVYEDYVQQNIVQAELKCLPFGRNAFLAGELVFIKERNEDPGCRDYKQLKKLKLFNLSNLSSESIIQSFAGIFPTMYDPSGLVLNLDIKMTFYEFFEGFISCNKLSILKSPRVGQVSVATSTPVMPRRTLSRKSRHKKLKLSILKEVA